MQYRYLGNTGLQVSVIGYGTSTNCVKQQNLKTTIDCVRTAYDLGINFFDTAQSYGNGEADRQLGQSLHKLNVPRSSYVLCSKIFWGHPQNKPNRNGLSRKHVIEGLYNSLKNLNHDFVDIVLAHRNDKECSIEETVRAFDWVVRKGLAHYWGTSEWDAQDIAQATYLCDKFKLIKPVIEQPEYNLYTRNKVELQYVGLVHKQKLSLVIWSPLFGGILTGKYNKEVNKQDRYGKHAQWKKKFQKIFGEDKQDNLNKLTKLSNLATQLNCTAGQLSIAWVLFNQNVTCALTGASKPEQLIETVKSLELLTGIYNSDIEKRIQDIFKNESTGRLSRKTMQTEKPIRLVKR